MRELVAHQVLWRTANESPGVEIVSPPHRFTYADLHERSIRLANGLRQRGIGRGSVVGVLDVNTHRYLELHYALSMLGAVLHTLNFRLPVDDLLYTVQHAGDEWLLVGEGFEKLAAAADPLVARRVWLTDAAQSPRPGEPTLEELIAESPAAVPPEANAVSENDILSIFYTTGTTGRPRGMRYRHRDMLLASLQILHHLALHRGGAEVSAADTFMPLIPFFHIHAWGTAFFVPYLGARLVLPGRADPAGQLDLIRREGVTFANLVPTQLHMLLAANDVADGGALPLKVLTGGSPFPRGLAQRAWQKGVRYSLIYGGSDQLATAISVAPPGDPESDAAQELLRTGTVPLPMVEVEVRGVNGAPVPRDGATIGELHVRSPWLPPEGYYRDTERSREAYREGWFASGDLAVRLPGGQVYVVDRERDAIKSGGEWIPSAVLEAVISEHPRVAAAAVLSAPDERWGERPVAVVQPSGKLDVEELAALLRRAADEGRLAKFWVPERIVLVEQIPITSAGKIHKAALRSQVGLA